MRRHAYTLKTGINRAPEFEREKLASFADNCGIKYGHDCRYCSTGAMLWMHDGFKTCGENPFHSGYAIVDPTVPERVALMPRWQCEQLPHAQRHTHPPQ